MYNNGPKGSRYGDFSRGMPFTTGKMFIVKANTDADFGEVANEFPPDDSGVVRVYTTLALAAAATVANRNDLVVCPKSLVTAAGLNALAATSILQVLGEGLDESGTIIIKKTLTSSAISTVVQALSSSAFGDLYVENVIVKTDATGLAGGTDLAILSTNVKGLAVIFEETIANLGASKTVDITTASVTKQKTVLESGQILQYKNTATGAGMVGGTGAGTADVFVVLRRVTPGAFVVNI